jgi:hypothetical protein
MARITTQRLLELFQEMDTKFTEYARATGNEIQALRSRVTELEAESTGDTSGFMLKSEYASGVAGVVKASERLASHTHQTDGFDSEGRITINEL